MCYQPQMFAVDTVRRKTTQKRKFTMRNYVAWFLDPSADLETQMIRADSLEGAYARWATMATWPIFQGCILQTIVVA
jgi:hypothetical protein